MTDKIEVGDKVQLTKPTNRLDIAVGSEGIVRNLHREGAEVWFTSQRLCLGNVPLTSLLKIRGAHPTYPSLQDTKPTNPKDAIGSNKPGLSAIPSPVLFELGGAMLEGACKYRRHNYREAGVRHSVYYDAIMRHLTKWWEGESIDPDCGFHHLVKVMACCAILRDSMLQGNDQDDRPPQSPAGWMGEIEEATKQLLLKFPNPKPPHCETDE